MTITPPSFVSLLTTPVSVNNFLAVQSAKLSVTSSSSSITFTDIPGTLRVSIKVTNSGENGCYLASGVGSATAVVSSSTPTPTSGSGVVSTCDYIAPGSIQTLDFVAGTNTWAAICSGSDTTTLEISMGYGN